MKAKKVEKRSRDEGPSESTVDTKISNKKLKVEKQEQSQNGDDEATVKQPMGASDKPLKSVDVNIFKYFKDLTSEEEKTRTEAALHLLQQIQRTKETDKVIAGFNDFSAHKYVCSYMSMCCFQRQKELIYCLKRLIRGCGASTNASRAGFFTGLVGLLKTFDSQQLTMRQIFEILNKELHVGAAVAKKEDADAIVGKILVCGAILHSARLSDVNCEDLEQMTNILLLAVKHRTYHASLGYAFLCEMIESVRRKRNYFKKLILIPIIYISCRQKNLNLLCGLFFKRSW